MQGYIKARMQGYKDTRMQGCKDAWMQGCRDAGMKGVIVFMDRCIYGSGHLCILAFMYHCI